MKMKLAASLLGVALFIPPVLLPATAAFAQDQPAGLPPQVQQLLEDKRPLQELSPDELRARFKALRQAMGTPGLPPEAHQKLMQMAEATRGELEARKQAGQGAQQAQQPPQAEAQQGQDGQPPAPMKKLKKQPAQQEEQQQQQGDQQNAQVEPAPQGGQPPVPPKVKLQVQQQAQTEQQPLADQSGQTAQPQAQSGAGEAPLPPPIQRLLTTKRDLKQMSDQDLIKYQRQLQRFSNDPNLPADARMKLAAMDQAAQAELAGRQQQPQQNAGEQPKTHDQIPQGQAGNAVGGKKPVNAAGDQTAQVPSEKPLEKPTSAAPAAPPPAPAAPDAQKVQQLDNNVVDPAAEKQAKTYLDDSADISKLSDDDLRKRLDDTRELLAANQLSQETERAVRAKLLKERNVLRDRLAQAEAAKQQQAATNPPPAPGQGQQQGQGQPPAGGKPPSGGKPPGPPPAPLPDVSQLPGKPLPPPPPPPPPSAPTGGLNFNVSINFISDATPPRMVLQDRRRPEDLQISELQRRIQVYDDAQMDDSYDPSYRDYWRQSLDYDRELLRRRLMWERRHRAMELQAQAQQDQLDVDITLGQPMRPHRPRTVFAAEVDDQELEDVLTAAPAQRYQPQYSVQDIANDEQLRDSLPRVEVDTIHFGYNEGFVREEELSHLDNIATLIERIVAKYPNEVFLIEGHTDAMGSDAYNLKLSKLRADSVKQMMSTYYNIPAKNLRTVGLGERFLKIPTADAEPENRRVSVARITSLLANGQ